MGKKILGVSLLVIILVGVINACDTGSGRCDHESCRENGPFYCVGKNNTCSNKTYCANDLYCSECD